MFISQPGNVFGQCICEELLAEQLGHRKWNSAEFAVAWVNHSGANKLFDSMRGFLSLGGRIRMTVGLDFGSTTYEGLSRLLELEQVADMTSHVFFDENPACTFHPKVFLFSNDEEACLFVGSNNMTGAGLETNIEAAVCFTGDVRDETIRGAAHALAAWRDVSDTRTRRLTSELLTQLRDRGYVLTEEEVRTRRRSEDSHRAATADLPLFGRSSSRPRGPGRQPAGERTNSVGRTTGSALGDVLLMRVRPRRNGGQVQISMKILEASFMRGAEEVVSVDGSIREIGYNTARGKRNTARFEAPEMRGMKNPVARFQWVNLGGARGTNRVLQYEIFDADNHAEGRIILKKLLEGMAAAPLTRLEELSQGKTVLSTSRQANAQWYRLNSA